MITEVRAISHLLLMALIFPISQNDSVFFLAPYSQTKGTEWALVFKCLSGVPLNTTGHFQFECTCKSNATVHLGISTALRGERKNGFRGLFPKSNKRVGLTDPSCLLVKSGFHHDLASSYLFRHFSPPHTSS